MNIIHFLPLQASAFWFLLVSNHHASFQGSFHDACYSTESESLSVVEGLAQVDGQRNPSIFVAILLC